MIIANYLGNHLLQLSLQPANEVWGKIIFSVACVKNSVHRGGGVRTPQAGTTPHPRAGTTPPRAGTPPRQVHLPPGQVPPYSRYPP